jgi:hypothetical protein
MGTHWEQEIKPTSFPLTPNKRNPKEKFKPPQTFLIGCMKFLFPNQFVTIFGLG